MGKLSTDLKDMGFTPTGRESPIDPDGQLWSNGYEVVCDETGVVIDGDHHSQEATENGKTYTYKNSGRVMLAGGHVSSYHWGPDGEGEFRYDVKSQ